MEDYSIVNDEYFYLKEKAFKDIQRIADTTKVKPTEEHKENVPEKRKKQGEKEKSVEGLTTEKADVKKRVRCIYCPHDNSPLETLSLGNIYIDFCPVCYGLWLDLGELERLLQKQLDKSRVFNEKLLFRVNEKAEKPLMCPLCGVELEKHKHFNADITSDTCPVCGGIWLDSGEFAVLYLNKRHEESAQEILAQAVGKYIDYEA
jgi:Zn-finger nucleic acid-binding protein